MQYETLKIIVNGRVWRKTGAVPLATSPLHCTCGYIASEWEMRYDRL